MNNLDLRDEAKMPNKAKHEEKTQKNIELDEFYQNQWNQIHQ